MPITYTSSARFGIRSPDGNTLIQDLDEGLVAMASDVDTKMVGYLEGTLAARPGAAYANRIYHATDTGQYFFDTSTAWVEIVGGSSAPIGTVANHVGAADPNANWLICDGRSLLRTAYPTLFNTVLGGVPLFGSVDGTHFNLPDLRGRVTIGSGPGPGLTNRASGASGGEETHTTTVGELPAHGHAVYDPGHGHGTYDPGHFHGVFSYTQNNPGGGANVGNGWNFGGAVYTNPNYNNLTMGNTDTRNAGISIYASATGIGIYNTGGGAGHNNMPPFMALNKIIRAL